MAKVIPKADTARTSTVEDCPFYYPTTALFLKSPIHSSCTATVGLEVYLDVHVKFIILHKTLSGFESGLTKVYRINVLLHVVIIFCSCMVHSRSICVMLGIR